ncbi:hypothetical protein AAL_00627 [Moelleriella libera RCEF 2490]|uniref:Uncharacterized protein n=1 Tax=Moelleriella libera RCEF 2490 TaxID=1081109 RepID=A0A166V0B2_9HYPO|nr:hypothetical protein AAL_00627 [Moelleriella libera RCEF 2490]
MGRGDCDLCGMFFVGHPSRQGQSDFARQVRAGVRWVCVMWPAARSGLFDKNAPCAGCEIVGVGALLDGLWVLPLPGGQDGGLDVARDAASADKGAPDGVPAGWRGADSRKAIIVMPPVLPKDEATARLQQPVQLPRHGADIAHRAKHLYAQDAVQTGLVDARLPQDLAVFDPARHEAVFVLEAGAVVLLGFLEQRAGKKGVRLDGVDAVDEVRVQGEAVQLVARAGAELEHGAAAGGDEGRDDGGVFVGDEAVGFAFPKGGRGGSSQNSIQSLCFHPTYLSLSLSLCECVCGSVFSARVSCTTGKRGGGRRIWGNEVKGHAAARAQPLSKQEEEGKERGGEIGLNSSRSETQA